MPHSPDYVGALISRLLPPGYTLHKLRHLYATRGYAGTGNLIAVKEALGYSSVATAQAYVAGCGPRCALSPMPRATATTWPDQLLITPTPDYPRAHGENCRRAVFLLAALIGCGSTSEPAAGPTTTTAEAEPSATDERVAEVAEAYVTENLGGDPASSSWGRYVTGYTYRSGVLRVAVQVDGASPQGRQTREQAARAIANFISLGSPPAEMTAVDWVEATDGAGTHIAQNAVN